MDGDNTPRSKLDFIYQDVLGEVTRLVERLEVVSVIVEQSARTCASERAADVLERAAAASSSRVRAELDRAADEARAGLAIVAKQAAALVLGVSSARRWESLALTAGLSLLASCIGGLVVVLAHSAGWW